MAEPIELSANDLAAMLCSKVCHDLINPVGAIGNGLEALSDPDQADMAPFAKELINNAARQAAAKLEFARLAYGASSSAGTEIDTRECERVGKLLFEIEKPDLDWQVTPVYLAKNRAKLLMNMMLIAMAAVPRGGTVIVKSEGAAGSETFTVTATGTKTFMPQGMAELVAGTPPEGVDARGIQPFYTGLLARLSGMQLTPTLEDGLFTFLAVSAS